MRNRILIFSLCIFSLLHISCDHNDSDSPKEFEHLVAYKKIATMSSSDIIESVRQLNPQVDFTSASYDVDYYQITYRTTYIDKPAVLSGLVMIPAHTNGKLKHFQYTHGSLFPISDGATNGERSTDTPSLFDHVNKTISGYSFFEVRSLGLNIATRGVVVSMPDYCGYGVGSNLEHTYVCAQNLAQESYDMLMATREFTEQLQIELPESVCLAGWSEGGSVSMYEQKLIEKNSSLSVEFNNCLAGPYYLETISGFDATIESADLCVMSGWAVLSHCLCQNINPSVFFKEHITDWNSLLYASSQPNASLETIFNQATIDNRDKLSELLSASTTAKGWIPQGPIHLYHGEKDSTVPYFNTMLAIQEFKAAGTPDDRVILHSYPQGDHLNFAWDFIDQTIQRLATAK